MAYLAVYFNEDVRVFDEFANFSTDMFLFSAVPDSNLLPSPQILIHRVFVMQLRILIAIDFDRHSREGGNPERLWTRESARERDMPARPNP